MDIFRFIWSLSILIYVSCQVANAQIQGCSLLGINIQECIDPGSSGSMESCCRTLNHAVQAGYYCLCLLLRSSTPLLSITLSLQLPNCYISAQPLTQCQKSLPVFHTPNIPQASFNNPSPRPVRVQMPPEKPGDLMLPSTPDDLKVPLAPKTDEIPQNATSISNSSVVEGLPASSSTYHPILDIPKPKMLKSFGGDKFNVLAHQLLLLPAALFAIM